MFYRTLLRLVVPLMAALLAYNFGAETLLATPTATVGSPSVTDPAATLPESFGVVYYIRPDGGSAKQCTGLADAPYPGSGSGQLCAWDHPFRALPPGGSPRIAGGDALIVASGEYQMGFGAPGSENCDESGSFDCIMPPIPSSSDSDHPTRILGAGWDSGCGNPPELWGSGRPWFIVNLTDSSNVEMACFEITDHSSCVEFHSGGLACERDTPPYGNWAAYGLHAEDSANVRLRDLNIHGLAAGGVHAGRLTDWAVENVRIAGSGSVGWDGDLWDENGDSNSGTLIFRHWVVEWNGCGETYPEGEPTGCWGQEAGGYGDGVGTGETGGDWIIEDSAFLHNTSDGLDLLYHTAGGSITLNRVRAEGNAGNQIKVTGQTTITNSVLVGNCAFFENQPFTYWVDHCRALGATLFVAYTGGEQVSILNSTLYGQGDGLVASGPREGFRCNGSETISARNSIFLGDADYFDSTDITFLFYQEGCANLKLDSDYNIVHNAKNIECGVTGDYTASGAHDYCGDPLLAGPLSGTEYGMIPGPGSPAIDAGDNSVCPPVDILGAPRPADGNEDGSTVCDIGAYEFVPPSLSTADLMVTKEDAPDPVTVGSNLTYTLTVTNNGPDIATDVVVMDVLPGGVTFVSAVPTQGSCVEAEGMVTCDLETLANGASTTVTIVVTPTQAGEISNTADVVGSETDPNTTNNTATAVTTVNAASNCLDNQLPLAIAQADPTFGSVPLTVQFDGDGSFDSDGSIVGYFWTFGDGEESTEPNPVHTYTDPGLYKATLRVTDNCGATSSLDEVRVFVRWRRP